MHRRSLPTILLLAAEVCIAMSVSAAEPPNYQILEDAAVFGMCQEPNSAEDIEALQRMGVDVVVRGISCAWHATPKATRERMKARARLRDLAREAGICFCTMITSAAMFPNTHGERNLRDWASRDAAGDIIEAASWHQGCLNDPGYRRFIKDIARAAVDGGADGIHYDESYSRWFWMHPIPCFCDDCCRELREFIRKQYGPQRAKELWGIDDLSNFNYRQYLREHGYAEKPYESPLHDVWWEMQMATTYRYEKEIVEDTKAYAREHYGREIVTNANQYQIATHSSVLTMESAVYDFVNIGTGWGFRFRDEHWRSERILPPQFSYVPQYKMARAHADPKHVAMFLDIQSVPEHIEGLPPEGVADVMQWLFAEAYASGCFFAAHHRFSNYEGPVRAQQRYGSFYKRYRDLFVGTAQMANIGVAFSYPSQTWDMYPVCWDRDSDAPAHCLQYYGVSEALADANLQYETVFFGDGDLFDLSPPAAELDRFHVLVLPWCYSMTDAAIEAIGGYIERGGTVIVVGDFGERDEHRRPREQPPEFKGTNVYHLQGDFEAALSGEHPDTTAELYETIVGAAETTPMVCIDERHPLIRAYCRTGADGSTMIVHLINGDFAAGRGFEAARDVNIEIQLPEGLDPDGTCELIGPDYADGEPVDVQMTRVGPGRAELSVPRIDVFRAVVIGQ